MVVWWFMLMCVVVSDKKEGKEKNKPQRHPPDTSPAQLSDVRAKANISFIGYSPMGIPIYRFSYFSEPEKRYQGTIAQAIREIRPDAVIQKDGVLFVDYSRLDVRMEELPRREEAAEPQ